MTAAEQALTEINERLAAFKPQLEGLHDFARLNLADATQREIAVSTEAYDRRMGVLTRAKAALEALLADGHPELPVREINAAALLDLQTNASTIEAALAQFASNAASTITLTAGQTVPKEPGA
jgi:hypothetical protein